MLKRLLLLTTLFIISFPELRAGTTQNEIDVVFCIDMSGSTNGLLPEIKNKIWDVVNGIYRMRPSPQLRIGIIGFSRPSFGKNNAFVKVLTPLTNSFDQVVYDLASLKPSIEKGDQFVGAALEMACQMNWSTNPKSLRVIYLMGNGMVNSGGFNYKQTCERLLRKNIFINTIYCMQTKMIAAEIPGWKFISDNTGGAYFTYKIKRNPVVKALSGESVALARLNEKLNKTFLYFGPEGKASMNNLLQEDNISMYMGDLHFFNRIKYKLADYSQPSLANWDLVTYVKSAGTRFQKLDRNFLPDSLKNWTNQELSNLVLAKKDERVLISRGIRSYLDAMPQDTVLADSTDLQGIIIYSVNKLARDKGFFQNQ